MSFDAAVVGSGPNGLAAAIRLAQAGRRVVVYEANSTVGGGARTMALTEPGCMHDVCSAVHPLGIASPYLRTLPLADHGLQWIQPPIAAAHPLDDGRAGFLLPDLDEMVASLGPDGDGWRQLIGYAAQNWDAVTAEFLRPIVHVPRSPLTLTRFGLTAATPATILGRRFESPETRALFAGIAAHTLLPLSRPFTSGIGLLLGAAAHVEGWPIPRGGSQAIVDAMVSVLESLGGEVITEARITHLDEVATDGPIIFDTGPHALAEIAGDALDRRYRDRLRKWRYGLSSFKVDYVMSEPVPWADARLTDASTVHLSGTADAVAAAEAAAWKGELTDRPFTLVSQPSMFDATRAPDGRHVLWAYCHAPKGFTGDLTETLDAHIEAFAPGFRDTVIARHSRGAAEMEADNANIVGGDIGAGSPSGTQIVFRPLIGRDPYRTPNPRIFLGSASTPPGAGVHGMCGFWAAESALAAGGRDR